MIWCNGARCIGETEVIADEKENLEKQAVIDFPNGWLQEELNATKADIENMSETEKETLQNNVYRFIMFLENVREDND